MKKLYPLFLLMFLASSAFAQVTIPITNAATTGTTVNETAIINSSENAVVAGTGNSAVPSYIVIGGAGTTGQAQLAVVGPASCIMDSTIASAAGWYWVVNSTATAGECHAQSATPSAGTWVIGYLQSASTASGVTSTVHVSPFLYGGGSGSSSLSLGANTIAGNNTGSTANAFGLTVSQLQTMLLPSPGPIGATTPAAGSFTALTATSFGVGATPPSCGSATGILCLAEASTAGSPASGQDYIRADSATHTFRFSINNSAEATLPTSGGSPTFPVNSQSATYQVLAADFASCKTITVPSGTFTVTLVASGSQPTTGQCVDVINYGTGVVTVARSGQNINGGTSSLTVAAGSATAPTGAHIVSDGTNYEAVLWGSSSGGSLPSSSAAQTYANIGGTPQATSAIQVDSNSTTGEIVVSGAVSHFGTGPTSATTTSGTLASGATSVTVVSTTGYPSCSAQTPCYLVLGSNNFIGEIVSATGSTGTTFTGLTRSLFATTATATLASGSSVDLISSLFADSTSVAPTLLTIWGGQTMVSPGIHCLASPGSVLKGLTGLCVENDIVDSNGRVVLGAGGAGAAPSIAGGNGGVSFNTNGAGLVGQIDGKGIQTYLTATLAVTSGSTTIAPVTGIVNLTGTAPTALATITVPSSSSCSATGTSCVIQFLGVGGTTVTSGNIGNVITMSANVPYYATYLQSASKWYIK